MKAYSNRKDKVVLFSSTLLFALAAAAMLPVGGCGDDDSEKIDFKVQQDSTEMDVGFYMDQTEEALSGDSAENPLPGQVCYECGNVVAFWTQTQASDLECMVEGQTVVTSNDFKAVAEAWYSSNDPCYSTTCVYENSTKLRLNQIKLLECDNPFVMNGYCACAAPNGTDFGQALPDSASIDPREVTPPIITNGQLAALAMVAREIKDGKAGSSQVHTFSMSLNDPNSIRHNVLNQGGSQQAGDLLVTQVTGEDPKETKILALFTIQDGSSQKIYSAIMGFNTKNELVEDYPANQVPLGELNHVFSPLQNMYTPSLAFFDDRLYMAFVADASIPGPFQSGKDVYRASCQVTKRGLNCSDKEVVLVNEAAIDGDQSDVSLIMSSTEDAVYAVYLSSSGCLAESGLCIKSAAYRASDVVGQIEPAGETFTLDAQCVAGTLDVIASDFGYAATCRELDGTVFAARVTCGQESDGCEETHVPGQAYGLAPSLAATDGIFGYGPGYLLLWLAPDPETPDGSMKLWARVLNANMVALGTPSIIINGGDRNVASYSLRFEKTSGAASIVYFLTTGELDDDGAPFGDQIIDGPKMFLNILDIE